MPPITPELDQRLLVYLFWAYTAAFALLFGYVWRLVRRLGELERELSRLKAPGRGQGAQPGAQVPGAGAGP
ncbi:ribonuclease BN [Thermaerobacter marianensis DSM 12885]|uniref:Ribonuclease BN n=1 Tax=Thermaerobacter marianensis (strain ATCC 700841 / DSM 12885 / JCM 10246 / 7p75a) TaxID=644966 RepID=E6SLT3_THEM7|nr:CcmD family protein [Thermaerobacter marianensis]ADU51382.1 ribonuclease BN [Thermaerobacter marianensis DSM 12885]